MIGISPLKERRLLIFEKSKRMAAEVVGMWATPPFALSKQLWSLWVTPRFLGVIHQNPHLRHIHNPELGSRIFKN